MHVKHLVLFGVFICKEKIHALLFSSINTLVNGILSIMRGSSFFFFEKLKLTLISTLKYYRIERTIMSDKKTRSQKDSSMTRDGQLQLGVGVNSGADVFFQWSWSGVGVKF
jgi:hypothetical protein